MRRGSAIRLLIVDAGALPPGVFEVLDRSSIECLQTDPRLTGIAPRRTDVVLLPRGADLSAVRASLESDGKSTSRMDKPSVLVLDDTLKFQPNGRDPGLDLRWLQPMGNSRSVARQILKTAGSALVSKGVVRRRKRPSATAIADALTKRRSRRPPRSPARSGGGDASPVPRPASIANARKSDTAGRAPDLVRPPPPPAPGQDSARPALASPSSVALLPKPTVLHSTVPATETVRLSKTARSPLQTLTGVGADGGTPPPALDPPAPSFPAPHPRAAPAREALTVPTAAPLVVAAPISLEGSRWLLLDDDVGRALAVATSLRAAGASAQASGSHPDEARLALFRNLDATGLLLEESHLEELQPLLRRFQLDPRLRWVPLLPVRWSHIYDARSDTLDSEALHSLLLPLWRQQRQLLDALSAGLHVDLSQVGPGRVLRRAAMLHGHHELVVQSAGRTWQLGVFNGELIVPDNSAPQSAPAAAGGVPLAPPLDALLQVRLGTAWAQSRPGATIVGEATPISTLLETHARALPAALTLEGSGAQSEAAGRVPAGALTRGLQQGQRAARSLRERWRQLSRAQRHSVMALASVFALAAAINAAVTDRGSSPPRRAPKESPQDSAEAPARADPASRVPSTSSLGTSAPSTKTRIAQAPAAQPPTNPAPTPTQSDATVPAPEEQPTGCRRWAHVRPTVPQAKQAKSAWRMARKTIHRGDLGKAEELLCLSVSKDPKGPGAEGLVRLYFAEGNLDAAAQWAQWAHHQQPDDPSAKQLLADVRHRQGRVDEARKLLHSAMGVAEGDTKVIQQVAQKYAHAGYRALRARDPSQAERLFRRSSTLDDRNALPLAGLSEISRVQGDVARALKYATAAVNLDARNFEGQLALGDAYAELKQPEEAREAWREAAKLNPRSAAIKSRLKP